MQTEFCGNEPINIIFGRLNFVSFSGNKNIESIFRLSSGAVLLYDRLDKYNFEIEMFDSKISDLDIEKNRFKI